MTSTDASRRLFSSVLRTSSSSSQQQRRFVGSLLWQHNHEVVVLHPALNPALNIICRGKENPGAGKQDILSKRPLLLRTTARLFSSSAASSPSATSPRSHPKQEQFDTRSSFTIDNSKWKMPELPQPPAVPEFAQTSGVPELPDAAKTGVKRRFEQIEKPLEDYRSYRFLELQNGLRAVVIHDPQCDKSGGCLSVRIGSLFDGKEVPGLAHFCEHMLFLGTKKYPGEDYYAEFLAKHGGSSNAYTSSLQTVFYFNVAKDKLSEATDVFAQFFLPDQPLFTPDSTDRELNAIHSEHTGNIQSDNWRILQLTRNSLNPAHPLNQFATGNLETLKDTPAKLNIDVRKALLDFHEKYYSANVMTFSVIGQESLDELEKLVVDKFGGVENKNVTVPRGKDIGNGVPPLLPETMVTEQKIIPVKDMRHCTFQFVLPEQVAYWRSKPTRYLCHVIGHEGAGSLLSQLKAQSLVTDLCAGMSADEAGLCVFALDVSLTELGETPDGVRRVGEMLFSYIQMLKEHGVSEEIHKEMCNIDEMNFLFRSIQDPTSSVLGAATGLHEDHMEIAKLYAGPAKVYDFDPKLIENMMSFLRVDNMRVSLVNKIYEPECDQTEHWYGTKHTELLPIDPENLRVWNAPRSATTEFGMKICDINPFVPENLKFKPFCGQAGTDKLHPTRYLFGEEEVAHLYHKQDETFNLPKALFGLSIYSPWTAASVKNIMMTELWSQALMEELSEYSYDAELAGLNYKIGADTRGVFFEVGGYDDKLSVFVHTIAQKINSFSEVPEHTWKLVHQRMERDLKNAATKRAPYTQAMGWGRRLMSGQAPTFEEKLETFEALKREDLTGVNHKILEERFLEGLAQGNLTRDDARTLLSDFVQALPRRTKPPMTEVPPLTALLLEENTAGADAPDATEKSSSKSPPKCVAMRFKGTNPEEKNGAAVMSVQVGKASVPMWMKASLYGQIVSQKFFDELRTKQQLGYIVACQPMKGCDKIELLFLVQSETPAWTCMERIRDFIKQTTELWKEEDNVEENKNGGRVSLQEFEEYKQALISQLEEKPKKLGSEFVRHWTEVRERTNDFQRRERSIQYLNNLEYAEFLEFCQGVTLDNLPRLELEVVPEEQWANTTTAPRAANAVCFDSLDDIVACQAEAGKIAELGTWLTSVTAIDTEKQIAKL